MCTGGGGPSGPSQAEIMAQEAAARARAQAELDATNAQRQAAKEQADKQALADARATALADTARKNKSKSILAGRAAVLEGETDGLQTDSTLSTSDVAPLDAVEPVDVTAKPRKSKSIIGAF